MTASEAVTVVYELAYAVAVIRKPARKSDIVTLRGLGVEVEFAVDVAAPKRYGAA